MTDEVTEVTDLIENLQPQPKLFCYKVTFSDDREPVNVAVMTMSATDAKEGLLKMVPEGVTIEIEPITTCTMLVQF